MTPGLMVEVSSVGVCVSASSGGCGGDSLTSVIGVYSTDNCMILG